MHFAEIQTTPLIFMKSMIKYNCINIDKGVYPFVVCIEYIQQIVFTK